MVYNFLSTGSNIFFFMVLHLISSSFFYHWKVDLCMAMLNLGDTLVPWRTWKKDNQNHGGGGFLDGKMVFIWILYGIFVDFIW